MAVRSLAEFSIKNIPTQGRQHSQCYQRLTNRPDLHPPYVEGPLSTYAVNIIFWLTPPPSNDNVIYEQPLIVGSHKKAFGNFWSDTDHFSSFLLRIP